MQALPEKIVFAIDLGSEMEAMHTKSRSRMQMVKLAVSLIVQLKAAMPTKPAARGTQFAVCTFGGEAGCEWLTNVGRTARFSQDSDEVLATVNSLQLSSLDPSRTFDLSLLVDMLRSNCSGSPGDAVHHVIMFFGRSQVLPALPSTPILSDFLCSPFVVFDVMYLHDPVGEGETMVREIFNMLADLHPAIGVPGCGKFHSFMFARSGKGLGFMQDVAMISSHPAIRRPQVENMQALLSLDWSAPAHAIQEAEVCDNGSDNDGDFVVTAASPVY